MSFLDIVFLVVVMFSLIIIVNVADYVHDAVFNPMNGSINQTQYDTIEAGWTQNKNFFDQSFAALFIIAGIASVLLAAVLAPYPAALAVFLLINLLTLFIYDGLSDYLTAFQATSLDTGAMNYAIAFWNSGVPKLIIGLNILMALVLFGKRVVQ